MFLLKCANWIIFIFILCDSSFGWNKDIKTQMFVVSSETFYAAIMFLWQAFDEYVCVLFRFYLVLPFEFQTYISILLSHFSNAPYIETTLESHLMMMVFGLARSDFCEHTKFQRCLSIIWMVSQIESMKIIGEYNLNTHKANKERAFVEFGSSRWNESSLFGHIRNKDCRLCRIFLLFNIYSHVFSLPE